MYDEGVSTRAIARFLDAVKIPTKQRGKGWHNYMVIKILKREGIYIEKHGQGQARVVASTPTSAPHSGQAHLLRASITMSTTRERLA